MKYVFFVLLILPLCINAGELCAQSDQVDSLENLLQTHKAQDSTRVRLLNELANAFQNFNPDKSLMYINEASQISGEINYKKGKAEALYQMSSYYNTISNFEKVLEYAQKSLADYSVIGDKKGMAKNMLAMGNIYYFKGDVEKALEYKHKALDINVATKDSLAISHGYANLGTNYCDIGNFALALEYARKGLEIANQINDEKSISYALNNLGVVYEVQGNFPKALECYQKSFGIDEKQENYKDAAVAASNVAIILNRQGNYTKALAFCRKGLDYSERIGFKTGLTYNYEYMGLIYKTKGDYEKALESHHKTLILQKEIGNQTGVANAYKDLAEIFCLQEKCNEAIKYYNKALKIGKAIENTQIEMKCYVGLSITYVKQKKYLLARQYSNKAFDMANEIGNVDLIKQSAEVLAQSKAALGDYENAYKLHVIFKNMSDSLYNEENIRAIANLEYRYKYEKEKELIELEQQKKDAIRNEEDKQQKIIRDSLILGIVLVLILALVVLYSFLQKHKANRVLSGQKQQIEDTNKELTVQKEEIQVFAQELDKANKTKDKFFSIIAHDLKSPFNGILGFLELLLKSHAEIDNKERELYIQSVYDSSVKTYKLLENLLTWSQAQKGIVNFEPEKIVVEIIVDEVFMLLAKNAKNKNIGLLTELDPELTIVADKNMLQTIVRNLVSNAIKFTPKGGVVAVKSRAVTVENNKKFAQISVVDTGVGITPEIQSRLFDIDESVSTKGTERESGTGLGLLLCKEFVEKHGGEIGVRSVKGKGSEFFFTVPLA